MLEWREVDFDGAAEIAFGSGRVAEASLPVEEAEPEPEAEPEQEPGADDALSAPDEEEREPAADSEVVPSGTDEPPAEEALAADPENEPAPAPAPALDLPLDVAVPGTVADHVHTEQGQASWFNAPDRTCAHKTLPFGTEVTVTRISTGESTTCTVADRGPVAPERVIDLSMDTFALLADPEAGIIEVVIEW